MTLNGRQYHKERKQMTPSNAIRRKGKKLHEVRAMQLKGTKNNHNRQTRHLNYIKKNYFFILK